MIACVEGATGGALVAVTGALVVITGEVKRRWDTQRVRSGRRPDRRRIRR